MPRYFATSISAKGKLMHEKTSIISLLNQNNVQLYIVHPSGHVSVYGTAMPHASHNTNRWYMSSQVGGIFQDCPKRKFSSFFRAGVDSSNSSSAIRANSVAVFNETPRWILIELHVLDLVLEIFKSATARNVNFTSYTNLSCFKINLTHIFFKFPRKTLQKYLGQKEAVNKKSRQRAEAVDTFCVPGRLSGSHTTTVK